jgi:5-methyltetrahydropteroyltriglutamate--homocysteine methyltransferase
VECRNSKVPLALLGLLAGKDILVGAIDVASDVVETPEDVASVVAEVIKHVPKERIQLCTNCGMAPMRRDIAYAKLAALVKGAALARTRYV